MLAALADLSPAAEQRSSTLTIPTEWFRWLPAAAVRLFLPRWVGVSTTSSGTPPRSNGSVLA